MAKLSTAERDKLPSKDFALPGTRDYPIHDMTHARNALARSAGKPEEAKVKAAAFKRYPDLARTVKCDIRSPLWKDESEHMVYGVVLTPGVEDSQGDIVEPDEIEKAAHRWLAEFRKHDVQHSGDAADIVPVESYIAPADFEVAGQTVLKGSWVIGAKVNDAGEWARVEKGELTGWSIEGSGVREAIEAVTT